MILRLATSTHGCVGAVKNALADPPLAPEGKRQAG